MNVPHFKFGPSIISGSLSGVKHSCLQNSNQNVMDIMFIWWYDESCLYLVNYACSVVSDFDSGILTWLQTLKKFEEYIFSLACAHTHIDRIAHGISEPYKYRQTPNNDDDKLIITSIFVAPAEPSQDMGKVRKMDYVLVSDNNKTDVFLLNTMTDSLITLVHVSVSLLPSLHSLYLVFCAQSLGSPFL